MNKVSYVRVLFRLFVLENDHQMNIGLDRRNYVCGLILQTKNDFIKIKLLTTNNISKKKNLVIVFVYYFVDSGHFRDVLQNEF